MQSKQAAAGDRPTANHRVRIRTSSDEELLALVRGGSGVAFSELYQRHYADAHRYAARLTRRHLDRDAADDIVAEAVRRVLTALHRGNGPEIGFRQYLFTAVRTVTATRRARCRREELVAEPPDRWLPAVDDAIDSAVAMVAFATLPQRWRDVLWATKVGELTPTELAPHVGLRANSVAALAVRAREALRIAYVRAHLPSGQGAACQEVLDLVARRMVTAIAPDQRRVMEYHLAACDECRQAATGIEGELATWMQSMGWGAVIDSRRVDPASHHVVDQVA